MQHLLCKMAQGPSVELLVQPYKLFVLMAAAYLHLPVSLVKALDTGLYQGISLPFRILRLASAPNTASGAGHHFHEMILFLSIFDLTDQRRNYSQQYILRYHQCQHSRYNNSSTELKKENV